MNIKKIHFIFILLIFCSISVTGIHASSSSVTVENHLHTGDVNIRIDEYQLNEYLQEEPYEPPHILMPGDMISKIPRITNLAEPCYIRAKITFPSTIDDVIPPVTDSSKDIDKTSYVNYHLAEKDILGLSADWVRIQDYYYYRPILETEESAVLFEGVRIPEYWDNNYASADFFIDIQVEAVQAAHFTPDYHSETPWGNITPEACIHNEPYTKPAAGFLPLFIEYEKDTKTLIAGPDDFFANFSHAMPGDILTDTVTLSNSTEHTAEFFFHAELPPETSNEQISLLQEIILSISVDGKALYHGNLFAQALSSDISLGIYPAGESREFVFTLSIPDYWTNQYALQDCAVKWVFSLMEESVSATPKTGEHSPFILYSGIILGSVLCISSIGFIRFWKRREKT